MKTLFKRMRIYIILKYKKQIDSQTIYILINIVNQKVELIFSKTNLSSKIQAIKTVTVQIFRSNIHLIYSLMPGSKILIRGISIKILMTSIHEYI